MKRNLCFLSCFVLVVFSCNQSRKKVVDQPEQDTKYELVKTQSIIIELDSTQGIFNVGYSQFYNKHNELIGSILNKSTGVIYYYDLTSGKLLETLQIEREGPNGIGTNLSQIMHFDISQDSIVIINNWDQRFYLLNKQGQVLNKYDLGQSEVYKNEGPMAISITNDNRPYYHDEKVYVNCHYNPEKDYPSKGVLLSLDLQTGTFQTQINPPKSYGELCWGLSYSLNILSTFNEKENSFVFSYGIDPDIYVYNQKGMEKHDLSSEFFKIASYSSSVEEYKDMSSWEARKNFSLLGPKYYKVIFLEEPNIYLRETFLPRTEDELAQAISGLKKSFIIANADFQKLGETLIPQGKYFTSNYFVTKKGVMLADIDHYNLNEDELKLDLYEPRKVN